MKAAMRSRPKSADDVDEDSTRTVRQSVVATAAKNEPELTPTTHSVAASANDQSDAAKPTEKVAMDLRSISERQSEQPSDEAGRRKMAADNLDKIATAIMAYKSAKGHYPPSAATVSGIKTLSWRVELLPYLGYEELYKKFDPKSPWNREPNKSLAQFIPLEFVSPERFDEKTNWLFPAHKRFMFGDGRYPRDRRIEDGIENTLMLLEVDDALAVEWTRPKDFEPADVNDPTVGLGGLREDGTFAAWANGWTTVLPAGVSRKQLLNALTYEDGDGQKAGALHREIEVDLVSVNETAAMATAPVAVVDAVAARPNRSAPVNRSTRRETAQRSLRPVPSESQLTVARTRLAEIYDEQIKDAEDPADHLRLSTEMLRQSVALVSDDAGAFALQTSAMEQAIDGNSILALLRAVDRRVRDFDVDAYETNVDALLAFGRTKRDESESKVQIDDFLKRSLLVVTAAIRRDDYDRAGQIVSLATRSAAYDSRKQKRNNRSRAARIGRRDEKEKSKEDLFKKLRSLLSSTKSRYEQATEQLSAFRSNPTDGDAASAVGQFFCFVKGDWETGLPLLARSGNSQLEETAQRDLAGANDIAGQVALGDMWWTLSERAKAGLYRQGSLDRAAHWYEQVYEAMPDTLEKFHVRARLDELAELDPGSPMASVRTIARRLRVDPEVTLEDVALSGVKTAVGKGGGSADDYTEG